MFYHVQHSISIVADEDAAAPVLGLILLIAVVFTLAVTVLLIGQNFGSKVNQGPYVGFEPDFNDQTLTVVNIDRGPIYWQDMTVQGCTPPTTTGLVAPGQTLTACEGQITIAHSRSETTLYMEFFNG